MFYREWFSDDAVLCGEFSQVKSMVQLCYKWRSLLTWVQCWYILQADPGRAGVSYDKEFIVCSLDLLSGLAEGLGSSIESLVCTYLIIHWFLFIVVYGSCAERGNTYLNPYAASLILSLGTRFLQFLWDWQVPDTVCKCLKTFRDSCLYFFAGIKEWPFWPSSALLCWWSSRHSPKCSGLVGWSC